MEMICTTVVPAQGHLGGASPSIFLHDSIGAGGFVEVFGEVLKKKKNIDF